MSDQYDRPPTESTGNPEDADVLDSILSAKEAAKVIGMPYPSFLALVRENVIPHREVAHMYLIAREDLEAYMAQRDA